MRPRPHQKFPRRILKNIYSAGEPIGVGISLAPSTTTISCALDPHSNVGHGWFMRDSGSNPSDSAKMRVRRRWTTLLGDLLPACSRGHAYAEINLRRAIQSRCAGRVCGTCGITDTLENLVRNLFIIARAKQQNPLECKLLEGLRRPCVCDTCCMHLVSPVSLMALGSFRDLHMP